MNQNFRSIQRTIVRRAAWLAAVVALAPCPAALAVLTHKYTFNDGTANDSVVSPAQANGTLTNGATVTVGGQLSLDGVNDFVNLPGPTIAINTYTNATFEGWFTINAAANWQRLFDFGDTNANGQGRNYIFYSPTSGGNDNRAALTNSDPGGGNEDLAAAGAPLAPAVQRHVAVVVDATGANAMSVYLDGVLATGAANPVPLTRTLTGVSNVFAYIGKSVWPDPTLNGFVNEFRIYDNALTPAQITANFQAGPDTLNTLALNVNTISGVVSIQNTSNAPLSFDSYQITSAGGKLKPANGSWNSLDDQNIDAIGANPGQSWDESGGSTANVLSELFLQGNSTVAPGASLGLGPAFNTALGAGDLKFQFTLPTGELLDGKVNYVTVTSSGDFNGDLHVNGADFLIWQKNLGQTGATLSQGDADGNGTVNAADLTIWKSSFGTAVAAAGGASTGVPEPCSGCLAGLVFLGAAAFLRRRQSS